MNAHPKPGATAMQQTAARVDPSPTQPPSVHLNWEDWLPYLEEVDVSEADKRHLIETLWAIMLGFVDLGWDIKTTQETGGQSFDLTAALQAAVVNSMDQEKEGP